MSPCYVRNCGKTASETCCECDRRICKHHTRRADGKVRCKDCDKFIRMEAVERIRG